MSCIKAVVLLWTCVIAFHASVTAIQFTDIGIYHRTWHFDDWDISSIKVNSCKGLLKSVVIHYEYIRTERTQYLFDLYNYTTPPFDIRGPRNWTNDYDTSPCDDGMYDKLQKLELPLTKTNVSKPVLPIEKEEELEHAWKWDYSE